MLKLEKIDFYKSISINDTKIFFEDRQEVLFVWRSNVGKSSLMNTIFWKKDLVKTSSKPGKTRLANLFLVDKKYFFTDLPGYGFAKLWKNLKADLDALISWYIEEKKGYIRRVVILIDSRLWPQQTDIDMYTYLMKLGIPMIIVLSKCDKISKNDIAKSIAFAEKTFFWQQVIAVSSLKKTWVPELVSSLKKALQ